MDFLIDNKKAADVKSNAKKILDEDEYAERLEKIIERDFFPDVVKLKAKGEYYDALAKNDLVKLRELHNKYNIQPEGESVSSVALNTPASFETPDVTGRLSKQNDDTKQESNSKGTSAKDAGLDKFLSKHTSEDDASFAELMKLSEARDQQKHAWLFVEEQQRDLKKDQMLALPSCEDQGKQAEKLTQGLTTWTYRAKNQLMYFPEGVERSANELVEISKVKPKEIVHSNTRFKTAPFASAIGTRAASQAATARANALKGRIGADGKPLLDDSQTSAAATPSVGGYRLMGTPSPAPGVDESPLMTWGEIESTPFRLEGGETPGPTFKIPETPARDKIALELAEKSRKQHRDKKKAALLQASASLKSPRGGSKRSVERLNTLSPAARRLASSHLRSSDSALRASYTPSPRSLRRPGDTPTPLYKTTPKNSVQRPAESTPRTPSTPSTPADSGLTDDLLQLPKTKRSRH